MTVLTIAQSAASRIGLSKPNSLVSSNGSTERQMLELLYEEIAEVSNRTNWQALTKEATFVTVAAESQGDIETIAPNLQYIINDTIWNRSLRRPVFGPLVPNTYQQNKAFYQSGPWSQYRIRGGELLFYPAPAAGQNIYFEYVTTAFITDSGGTDKTSITADSDTPKLDNELITLGLVWRFKQAKGLDYSGDFAKYTSRLNDVIGRDASKPMLHLDNSGYDVMPGIFIPAGSWSL